MKKIIKQFMAVLITALMTVSMAASVFAAAPTGSITIQGNNGQSLKGKTFTAYRLFDLAVGGDEKDKYSYTETNTSITTAVKNAIYTVKQISAADASAAVEELGKFSPAEMRQFADVLKTQLEGIHENINEFKVTDFVYDSVKNTVSASGLPYGYYAVLENTTTSGTDAALSLAMIDSVNPEWKQNIKSDYPSVEKKVAADETKASYGDVADYDINDHVPFKLTGTMPAMEGYDTYQYNFYDKLDAGLTFEKESVTVTLCQNENIVKTLVSGVDYTIETENISGNTFAVKIKDLLTSAKNVTANKIVVDYTAVLNENAVIAGTGNFNQVYLEYSNNPYTDEVGKTVEDKVVVFTYQIKMDKYDAADKELKLKDAIFELYTEDPDTVEDAAAITFKKLQDSDVYVSDATVSTTDLTTNANGYFNVKGLDTGIYYLKEKAAPTGYNLLKKAIKIEISAVYDEEGEKITSYEIKVTNDGTEGTVTEDTVKVANSSGAVLPSTGGMGTTILYVLGILAMAGGVFYFVMNRKSKEK